jgi:hypothetical protein
MARGASHTADERTRAAVKIQKVARGRKTRKWFFSRVGDFFKNKFKSFAHEKVEEMAEWIIFKNFQKVMDSLNKHLKGAVQEIDPFMFDEGKKLMGTGFDMMWPTMVAGVHRRLYNRFSKQTRAERRKKLALREALIRAEWPDPPPMFPNLLHYLKCTLLYAWSPADLTLWGQLRTPRLWPWMIMLLFPIPQVELPFWIFLYWCSELLPSALFASLTHLSIPVHVALLLTSVCSCYCL